MSKKLYGIEIRGCDAETYFNISLTDEQFEAVKELSNLSHLHSTYGCEPDLTILDKPLDIESEDNPFF